MPCVSYIGVLDEQYPRNQVIRAGLAAGGWEVRTAPLPRRLNTLRKLLPLWRAMRREAAHCDLFVLAEFNQLLAPWAVFYGRLLRRPVAVDYLVGLYDASVQDRESTAPNSLRARLFRAIDRWNCAHAPLIFTDTPAHREGLHLIVGPAADRLRVVPVGAYDAWWYPRPARPGASPDSLLVQFFGSYIPFHGIDVILRAAHLLRSDRRFRFELIGRGQTYRAMAALAGSLALDNVEWIDSVPAPDLPERVAAADICLGVFGDRAKTDYVVPNKLYQVLAMGKPAITAESAAVRAYFTPGEHLLTIPPGDPAALAAALRTLADDADLRARLGAAGAARIREAYRPEMVTAALLPDLSALLK